MLAARRGKKRVLQQGVAHQAARRVFLVGVKNRLMPREPPVIGLGTNFFIELRAERQLGHY
jgi:hypothetical protein